MPILPWGVWFFQVTGTSQPSAPPPLTGSCLPPVLFPVPQDPTKRATIKDVLRDDWLKENGCATDTPLDESVVTKIKTFANMNRLKKEAFRVPCLPLPSQRGLPSLYPPLSPLLSFLLSVLSSAAPPSPLLLVVSPTAERS